MNEWKSKSTKATGKLQIKHPKKSQDWMNGWLVARLAPLLRTPTTFSMSATTNDERCCKTTKLIEHLKSAKSTQV